MIKDLGAWLTTLGPLGLFLISLLDSIAIPMPQGVDALLIAQSIAAPETAYIGATLAILGSLIGSLVLYYGARRVGRPMLERKTSAAGIEKMRRQIEQFDALVLILPTMIPLPLPMKLFVIAAGVFQMKVQRFIAAIVFARSVRYYSEAFIAVRYGDETTAFLKEHALAAVLIGAALVALFYLVNRWSTRRMSEG